MQPAPERWTAIVNPAAGRGRARARLPHVLDALATAALDVEIMLSADAADLVALARSAFGRGRAVAACGGDGTVCALAGVDERSLADVVDGALSIGLRWLTVEVVPSERWGEPLAATQDALASA